MEAKTKKRLTIVGTIVVLLALITGVWFYLKKKKESETIGATNGSNGSPDTGINTGIGGGAMPSPGGFDFAPTPVMTGSDGSPDTNINTPPPPPSGGTTGAQSGGMMLTPTPGIPIPTGYNGAHASSGPSRITTLVR